MGVALLPRPGVPPPSTRVLDPRYMRQLIAHHDSYAIRALCALAFRDDTEVSCSSRDSLAAAMVSAPQPPPPINHLADALKLMRPSDLDGQRLSVRPKHITDGMLQGGALVFRERSHNRRAMGCGRSIDSWRDSGGKLNRVLLDIPKQLQAETGGHNVVVLRHGMVVRACSSERLRYRRWNLATLHPDGSLTPPAAKDAMLFQVCTIAQAKQLFCRRAVTAKPKQKVEPGTEPNIQPKRKRKRALGSGPDFGRTRSQQPSVAGLIEEIDFDLLGEPDAQRLFPREAQAGCCLMSSSVVAAPVLV